MSLTQKEIVAACKPLLENVHVHETQRSRKRCWITAYQLWVLLKAMLHPICDKLIDDCGGDYVGEGAGSNVGPAQKIGQALGNDPDIETEYLNTRYFMIDGNKPSDQDCGLFRIKKL